MRASPCFLFPCFLAFTAIARAVPAAAGTVPCSRRYREAFRLHLTAGDVGLRGEVPGLIFRNASGKEHIRIVRGDDAHPVVIEVRFPAGSYSQTYKAQFRAAAGMRDDRAGCLRYAVRFGPGFRFADFTLYRPPAP